MKYIIPFNFKNSDHTGSRKMRFFNEWNPREGGSLIFAVRWVVENLGCKPGFGWELHVLKTKKHPYGFFGPGGIAWRHRLDRHDQNALDIISEWSDRKWRRFIHAEEKRRDSVKKSK